MTQKALLLLFILLAFSRDITLAQEQNAAIINSLNSAIKPIDIQNENTFFTDIDFLKEKLKDKEVIALGEVTHGTAEVFNYKDRLVRFLVTNLNYKAIAFESDFIAIGYIDDYITGKTDSVKYTAGTAIMMSNTPMIKWLRQYNKDKPDADKVRVYGLECRNYYNILERLMAVVPELDQNDKRLIQDYLAKPFNTQLTKAETNGFKSMVARLQSVTLSDLNRHYVDMLDQMLNYQNKREFRDNFMAQNATWVKERAKGNQLIVWAHNGHVAKDEVYHYPNMGTHLSKKYGSQFYVIGTDFNSGKANVNVFIAKNKPLQGFQPYYYGEIKSDKWYEYYFGQCRYKNFILDVQEASQNKVLQQFLTQPRIMRSIGALSSPEGQKLSIAKNFDMIVYIDKTSSM